MCKLFSDHVAALAASEDVDEVALRPVLDAIWKVLGAELRRRTIYASGPSLLGYEGASWEDEDAQHDIVQDAYCRGVLSRLGRLNSILQVSGDIEKLVKGNFRNFVGERQRKLDPAGYAIFQNIKTALTELCRSGFLTRVGKDLEDRWHTDDQFCIQGDSTTEVATAEQLGTLLEQTGIQFEGLNRLLRISESPQPPLLEAIQQLTESGCSRFSVKALKNGLIDLATAAGISLTSVREHSFSEKNEEFLKTIRTVSPDSGYEHSEHCDNLFREVREAIDELSTSDKIKKRFHAVAAHLRQVAVKEAGHGSATLDELSERFGTKRSTTQDDINAVRDLCDRLLARNTAKGIGDRDG
jgi:hypothetical protein